MKCALLAACCAAFLLPAKGFAAAAAPSAPSAAAAPAAPPAAAAPAAGVELVKVDPAIEAVLRSSQRWLVSRQLPSGAWNEQGNRQQAAFTGYAMMALMACGNTPGEGEFGKAVARGAQFLTDCIRPDGFIAASTGEANMYGHGIASIALAELYGQTRDPALRGKLERVIHLTLACQNGAGGWRYSPHPGDADISVTVLQVVALRAARNSGIDVPQSAVDKAIAYVKSCQHPATGGFTYQTNSGNPGFARTAAAIYSLQVCGLYDDPLVAKGEKFLFDRQLKDMEWFTYGNFYAAPALYMIGGDSWKKWYGQISGSLMQRVHRQGELAWWDPLEGGPGQGPLYATSVYTAILAMPYHYIPLYQR